MSTALVSGAAALVKARDPQLTPSQIESRLTQAANNIDAANPRRYQGKLGAGRLNVGATLAAMTAADLNQDGWVDDADLEILLAAWGSSGSPADLNGDGTVGVPDLLIILAAWQ